MTKGEWMYYGGLAWAILSLILTVIWKVVLAGKRRKIKKVLTDEYVNM